MVYYCAQRSRILLTPIGAIHCAIFQANVWTSGRRRVDCIAFAIVAKGYEYRQRDEPDNIYRYAEEYYDNTQDEPNYDYDDYYNLNVETID